MMPRRDPRVMPWRGLTSVLLAGAAAGAVAQSANASIVGRVAGVGAALFMALVALGVWRRQAWAVGLAFLLGICWFWAAFALRAQGSFGAGELVAWLAWSIVVIVASVRSRPVRTPIAPLGGPDV
jgi:hypothetical protein